MKPVTYASYFKDTYRNALRGGGRALTSGPYR